MKFGPCPIDQACGGVLAHSISLPSCKIGKGTVLTQSHVDLLHDAGEQTIIVARLGPDDIDENTAADILAEAFCTGQTGIRASRAHTGRVNLFAQSAGVVAVDADAITRFNQVNPMITIATVPQFQRLLGGDMIATIKIIAYAISRQDLEQAVQLAKDALVLHGPKLKSAQLIETRVPGQADSSKGYDALTARLARLDADLGDKVTCAHTVDDLTNALGRIDAEVVFVLTGSATSDIADVGPTALTAAGGDVLHFGMPVDPGNLLFIGHLNKIPVIGLPGCARSIALNGADWVLERVICGLPIGAAEIQSMGVGGLLKEIAQRGHPRLAR